MKFYSVTDFAKILRLTPQTIRKSIRLGKINAIRPGISEKAKYRIPESELERLMVMHHKGKYDADIN